MARIEAQRLLEGAVDTHVHSGPDVVQRKVDDLELARNAKDASMAGLVLKNHHSMTFARAYLVSQAVPGIKLFGGLVLNQSCGGLNPVAVEVAMRTGTRVVWMPTAHSAHQMAYTRAEGARHTAALDSDEGFEGITVLDGEGKLKPEVYAILEQLRDAGAVLCSGHLSPTEIDVLVAGCERVGLKKILLTHPEAPFVNVPVEQQQRLAARGVLFERCANMARAPRQVYSMARLAEIIRTVGVASTVLATDMGQPQNPLPHEGLAEYVQGLLDQGFSEDELRTMTARNARALLDF